MFDKGFLGDVFDFDRDGKLSPFEKAADMGAFILMVEEGEKDREDDDEE